MIIVSDTSVITNLKQIGQLEILEKLFKRVIVPQKVSEELLRIEGRDLLFEENSWLEVRETLNKPLYEKLLKIVDPGEAESIALALENKADLLLIDEKKGRKVAEEYGLAITGLVGILIDAKSKNYINDIKPILDELIYDIGFRVSPKLYHKVLKMANE
jgi:predicted nucleic acid-binding protein